MSDYQDNANSRTIPQSTKLHRHVAQTLRQRLISGEMAGGAKLPSLREMAEEFGVSTMTIRQAIGVLEKEGHLYRVSAAGTYVRPTTQEKKPTVQMVAFIAVHLGSPFEMEIARSVEKACQQKGWAIQIFDAHSDVELETSNILRLTKSNSHGAIILHTCDPKNVQILYELKKSGFPFVLVDRYPSGINIDIVESNHEHGAYLATKYLLEKGHSQILMLTPPPFISSVEARIHGYERALSEAGMVMKPDGKVLVDLKQQITGVREKRSWFGGYAAILPVLKKQKKPLAIFTSDAYTGWGVYQACRELDLGIPEDVSVVCFDDTDVSRALVPPMTAIAQRTDQIGYRAVELLEKRLEHTDSKADYINEFTHSVIDVELIERQSVASPVHG
ncbi:MAG: GntR family transcriptional regulator [Planctomycetota bacterium]|nr:MAG: GntR family transcriptional regulator [Planctomycetota bacterium]